MPAEERDRLIDQLIKNHKVLVDRKLTVRTVTRAQLASMTDQRLRQLVDVQKSVLAKHTPAEAS
jgi:hypothetical protein